MKNKIDVPKISKELCIKMMNDIENYKRPILEAIKCNLDNAIYDPKVGYLVPGDKKVKTELNVSSVKKLSRALFVLEILLSNIKSGSVNNLREIYYISKGMVKHNPVYKPLDFESQGECDDIIYFITEILELYREELNCFANDRGGQTYSKQLIVEEILPTGKKAVIELGKLGTSPFQPKNKKQNLKLRTNGKIDFALIVESEGTANTLVSNGFTERNNCILIGSQGVPSNAVRSWCKLIQDELNIPLYFFGDLDSFTIQNIYRTLKSGSANSIINNKDYSCNTVKFLGVLPEDIKRYDLPDYSVNEKDVQEVRALKKADDVLKNDPFFKDKKNKKLRDVLIWLKDNKRRCEQQSFFSVDPTDRLKPEKIILEKIKKGWYID